MGFGRPTTSSLAACAMLVTIAIAPNAAAAPPDKAACADAATRGQVYRDDKKFKGAEEAFTLCSQSSCPPVVRKSCIDWLSEIQSRMPSITVRVATHAGATPLAMRLRVDDSAAKLDQAVRLDPGSHTIRIEADGHSPVIQSITVRESESRTIELPLPKPLPTPVPPERPVPLGFWILGGVAVAGVASFAAFGISAKSETDRMETQCAPACATNDADDAYRLALVADISLVVGSLAAIGAAYVFFTRPWRVPEKSGSNAATIRWNGTGVSF